MSAHGGGAADLLSLVAVWWVAQRAGDRPFTSGAFTRHPDSLPRPSLTSVPLVLRI